MDVLWSWLALLSLYLMVQSYVLLPVRCFLQATATTTLLSRTLGSSATVSKETAVNYFKYDDDSALVAAVIFVAVAILP